MIRETVECQKAIDALDERLKRLESGFDLCVTAIQGMHKMLVKLKTKKPKAKPVRKSK